MGTGFVGLCWEVFDCLGHSPTEKDFLISAIMRHKGHWVQGSNTSISSPHVSSVSPVFISVVSLKLVPWKSPWHIFNDREIKWPFSSTPVSSLPLIYSSSSFQWWMTQLISFEALSGFHDTELLWFLFLLLVNLYSQFKLVVNI